MADKFKDIKDAWGTDSLNAINFQKVFRENYDFYRGKQWSSPETKSKPKLVFNRIKPAIDAIQGSMISAPRDVIAIPRTTDQNADADAVNDMLKWFREKSNANDNETAAFRDALIGGVGYLSIGLDFEADPNGKPVYDYINPAEMVFDSGANRPNITDARRMWRITWHTAGELQSMFPRTNENDYGFPGTDNYKPAGISSSKKSKTGKLYSLVELRQFEPAPPLYMLDSGETVSQKPEVGKYAVLPQKEAVRYLLGQKILRKDPVLAAPGSLGWHCITAYNNSLQQDYYGVIDNLKDVQGLINRMISQMLYTFDRSSKGGLIAERGAFENDRQAEKDFASNDKIVYVAASKIDKVRPLSPAQVPPALTELLRVGDESFNSVSGISAEFIGTREAVQANVLEQNRQQSTINVLGTVFNNLKSTRLAAAEDIIYLAKHWISDKTLIKGEQGYKYFDKKGMQAIDYDLYISDAPAGENEKAQVFARLIQIVPQLAQLSQADIDPNIITAIIKYSPLPANLIDKTVKSIEESAEPAPEQEQKQEEQAQMQDAFEQQKFREGMAESKAKEVQATAVARQTMEQQNG